MYSKGKVSIVCDLVWGDCGKGKITDYLNEDYDIGVRFGGGANSGHVCVVNGKKYVSQLLPVMSLRNKCSVLSPGVFVAVDILKREIENLGIDRRNVLVDFRCPIVTKEHIEEDIKSGGEIGTTKNGIGPCAKDNVARIGKRYEEYYKEEVSKLNLPFPMDTRKFLYESIHNGKSVLFEGNQGYGLDIKFGTYPFVTSSCCLSGGVMTNAGIPWNCIDRVYGIFKAYTTRVGFGDFPTEIRKENIYCDAIRKRGNEYGSVTGRPRRIGWLDLTMLKEACETNGVTDLVCTKADVLDERLMGHSGMIALYHGETKRDSRRKWKVYKSGQWGNLSMVNKKENLPKDFREFLADIEIYCETKISMISLGAERENIIHMD